MPQSVFINLPVADVARAEAFYHAIGCTPNTQFSQPGVAAAMVLSDSITFMLLSHAFFAGFTPKPIADAHGVTEVLLALAQDSRAAVDAIVDRAAAAGGRADIRAVQDMGFMYSRSFEDPDGHIFEPFHMDVAAAAAAMAQPVEA